MEKMFPPAALVLERQGGFEECDRRPAGGVRTGKRPGRAPSRQRADRPSRTKGAARESKGRERRRAPGNPTVSPPRRSSTVLPLAGYQVAAEVLQLQYSTTDPPGLRIVSQHLTTWA